MMRKHITPHEAERMLGDVPKERYFRLKIGAELANLKELAEVLEIISDDTFRHHVNEKRNDFAKWIRDVVYDSELADTLIRTKTREKTIKFIKSRIKFLEKRKQHGIPLYSHEWMVFGYRDFLVGFVLGIVVGYLLYYVTLVWAF